MSSHSLLNFPDDFLDFINRELGDALSKTHNYLIGEGVALSLKQIKNMPRIEIKTTDKYDYEYNIYKILTNNINTDLLETSTGFNTTFPFIKKGVIKSFVINDGVYFTVFDVISETDKNYDLQITEYFLNRFCFHIRRRITVEKINKRIPLNKFKYSEISTLNDLFVKKYKQKTIKEFTNKEIKLIERFDNMQKNHDIDTFTCVAQVLLTFRIVNFIHEKQNELGIDFYNNEYFLLKNISVDSFNKTYDCVKSITQTDDYLNEILQIDNGFKILQNHSIEYVINELVKKENISYMCCAVGFVFESGLNLLSSALNTISEDGNKCELIVGSLQNYNNNSSNNRIDKSTVHYLNTLLSKKQIRLYTHKPSFYHGKFYYLSNKNKAFVITGSTNISKSAFQNNYELDLIYVKDKDSQEDKQFIEWYTNLKNSCEEITVLNEDNFSEYNWDSELDAFNSLKNHIISKNDFMEKLKQLSDEETKYRLNLWIEKKPTAIYDDIEIKAFADNNYILFYYATNNLAIFESFEPNNAYYAFSVTDTLADLLESVTKMSKNEIQNYICYIKKGYHTLSHEKLEKRINYFFE